MILVTNGNCRGITCMQLFGMRVGHGELIYDALYDSGAYHGSFWYRARWTDHGKRQVIRVLS